MDGWMHIDMRLILGAIMHLPGKVGGMEERKLCLLPDWKVSET